MDDAVEVLREALRRSNQGIQTGPDVRLALRTLRFLGIPHSALRYFWDSCQTEQDIGRSQNMNAALNGIELFRQGKLREGG